MTNENGYIDLRQVIKANSALREAVTLAQEISEEYRTDTGEQEALTFALQKAVKEYELIEEDINAKFAN